MTSEERAEQIMNAGLVPRWVMKGRIIAAIDAAVAEAVTAERKAKEELLGACGQALLEIEYLHKKFRETGTGNAVIVQIETAMNNATEQSPHA